MALSRDEYRKWENLMKKYKLPPITNFRFRIDLTEADAMQIRESGKLSLEQLTIILDSIERLDENTSLVLPQKILYELDPKYVKKNCKRIMLKRIYSKKEAIENELTPQKLIKEKIYELREKYERDNSSLVKDNYAFINYRGITDKKTKNYLIVDAIEGYLLCNDANGLIKTKRYDTLEALLKLKHLQLPREERAFIRREIMKIRRRETLTEKERKRAGFIREIILNKQAVRIALVPSKHIKNLFYRMKFNKLPLKFNDGLIPDLEKLYYATWTDLHIEPACNCEDKAYFINYINPGEIYHCVHEIAAFRKFIKEDWKDWTRRDESRREGDESGNEREGKTGEAIRAGGVGGTGGADESYNKNPCIATSQFFKPSKQAIEYYLKLRNQVFVKKVIQHGETWTSIYEHLEHLPKIYIELFLEKQVRRAKIELM